MRTAPVSEGSADPEREALVERLLLAGLDQYFEGQYERAVGTWSRVAFLERGHGRARAYIDRARSAIAERQRQSDECLHRGLDAFRAGDLAAARDLLTRAVEGANGETAVVFLERLGVAEAGVVAARALPSTGDGAGLALASASRPAERHRTPAAHWVGTVLVSVGVAAAILLAAQPVASWLGDRSESGRAPGVRTTDPVPIVRPAELRLARARDLRQAGQVHDALRLLEGIDRADLLRADADALITAIQAGLLASASAPEMEAAR